MNFQNEKKESILERIVKGELQLSTKKEYVELLALFPDKADLKRAYADFLYQCKEKKAAYRTYLSAADLYVKAGKTLQAIVAKILAWRIIKPTHHEGRLFHAALQADTNIASPLQFFFSSLPYPEFIAIMLKMVRVRVPAGKRLIKAGSQADVLYFIVSGELEEILYPSSTSDLPRSSGVSQRLSDNDICGDVFPPDRTNFSRSDVKTLTKAELVKLTKTSLVEISNKYPLVENLLRKLYKSPSAGNRIRAWASVRRSARHMTPVKLNLKISIPQKSEDSMTIEAMSRDISLGGACLDLGLKYGNLSIDELVGSKAVLTVDLPNTANKIAINGEVVWGKKLNEPSGIGVVAGIKFEAMERETTDLLNVYCFGIENEQTLMWSLWESYMG